MKIAMLPMMTSCWASVADDYPASHQSYLIDRVQSEATVGLKMVKCCFTLFKNFKLLPQIKQLGFLFLPIRIFSQIHASTWKNLLTYNNYY